MKIVPPIVSTQHFENLPIRISTQYQRAKVYLHMHDHIQLCYVKSGTLHHTINGKKYIQEPDSCSVILPFIDHITDLSQSDDTPIVIFISFIDNFMSDNGYSFFPYCGRLSYFENYAIPQIYNFKESEKDDAKALFEGLTVEFSKKENLSPKKTAVLLGKIFTLLCTKERVEYNRQAVLERVRAIKRSVNCIDFNYQKKLTIDSVCPIAGMSRSTFTTHFKEITNLTFSQYLLSRRLTAVRNLLLSQHHSKILLDNVAKLCGLGDRTNLTRLFTRHFGVSPSKFCIDIFTSPERATHPPIEYTPTSSQKQQPK